MTYELIIPGEPTAKQRPKHGKGYTYTPEKTVNYENLVKVLFAEKYGQAEVLTEGLKVEIIAYFGIPKSTSKIKANAMRWGNINPTKKPDTDNIAKIVLDALNGIAFKDDSQVVELRVVKLYSDVPRVKIEIKQ